MVLEAIPVLPPGQRPLDFPRNARPTSKLNFLYERVMRKNNRLERLMELKTHSVIIKMEKKGLQEAVDALFDNGRRNKVPKRPTKRLSYSLSDIFMMKLTELRIRIKLSEGVKISNEEASYIKYLTIDLLYFLASLCIDSFFYFKEYSFSGMMKNIDNIVYTFVDGVSRAMSNIITEEVLQQIHLKNQSVKKQMHNISNEARLLELKDLIEDLWGEDPLFILSYTSSFVREYFDWVKHPQMSV